MPWHLTEEPTSTSLTRVLVVDDHRTFADLLALGLDAEPDFECVGTAHTIEEGIARALSLRPDVVMMDVQLGSEDGIEATAELTRLMPEMRVVVLTAHASHTLLERSAAAGACCLLPKDGSLDELLVAVRSSRRDGFVVHPSLLKRLVVPAQERRSPPAQQVAPLTQREDEVLQLLAEGMDARAIGRQLGISLNTCRGYVRSLLMKLDAHSQLEAVAVAKRNGLLHDDLRS